MQATARPWPRELLDFELVSWCQSLPLANMAMIVSALTACTRCKAFTSGHALDCDLHCEPTAAGMSRLQFGHNAIKTKSALVGECQGKKMPAGLPSPDHIIGRKVTFFSIDTNVMEGKGFDFHRGALNVLHRQRPAWMTLQLSDIVEREIHAHRLRDLTEAKQKLDSALSHMRRKCSIGRI